MIGANTHSLKKIHSKNNKSADLKNYFNRLKKSPIYSAFKRQNLGSIPSKIDNYIFNLEKEPKNNKHSKLKLKLKSENNLFINDLFENEHRSWKNYGTGNNIEIKGNIFKISVNNDLQNLNKKVNLIIKILIHLALFILILITQINQQI